MSAHLQTAADADADADGTGSGGDAPRDALPVASGSKHAAAAPARARHEPTSVREAWLDPSSGLRELYEPNAEPGTKHGGASGSSEQSRVRAHPQARQWLQRDMDKRDGRITCPYNRGHRMPFPSLRGHLASCPDGPAGAGVDSQPAAAVRSVAS